MRRLIAILLCGALTASGCASSGVRVASAPQPSANDQQVLSDYVQKLPAGSRVRVEQADGHSFRGTLMKATTDAIVVQKHTRVPEAPVEIPLRVISRVTLDNQGSSGKAIAIGVAAGVGGFLAVLGILAAIYGD
jgi:hypothetical protein